MKFMRVLQLMLWLIITATAASGQPICHFFAPPKIAEIMDTSFRLVIPEPQIKSSDLKFQIRVNEVPYGNPTSVLQHQLADFKPGENCSLAYEVFEMGHSVGISSSTVVILRPSAPSYFSACLSDGRLEISWGESEGATGYQLFVDQSKPLLDFVASQTYAVVDVLKPGDNWTFQMAAYNSGGYSAFSESATISVPSIKLKCKDITQNSAVLEWTGIAEAEAYHMLDDFENI